MKRFLIALVVAVGLASAAYGAAAAVTVHSGAAQVGSATPTCQTDALQITYNFDDVTEGTVFASNPTVSSINISGIDGSACNAVGARMYGYVYSSGGTLIGRTASEWGLVGDAAESCSAQTVPVGYSTITAAQTTGKVSLCATDSSGNEVDSLVSVASIGYIQLVIN